MVQKHSTAEPSILQLLGIVGYDSVESVVIAALATEAPLLIIGPHGTAKSLLLNLLAEALRLEHRHYNAAMINFDDLIGFPYPNESKTGLEYIPTKGSIWGVESVFIDEISRTRVDMQNRLFPIIHEKMIQGIPLSGLRFRWAAMNPPRKDEEEERGWTYEGSEPLDVALADRFPFILSLPSFAAFSESHKLAVIRGQPEVEAAKVGTLLSQRINLARVAAGEVRKTLSESIGSYVLAIHALLEKMKRPISPRRARMLHDAIVGVIAAESVAGRHDSKSATFMALTNALPHPAYGEVIDALELLTAHNQAWKLAEIPATDPRRLIFAEPNPVKRVALGLSLSIPDLDMSILVQDAYASLEAVERICFGVALYPIVSTTKNLTAVAFEALADEWFEVENQSARRHQVASGSKRHRQWQKLVDWISEQTTNTLEESVKVNIALVLFEREVEFEPEIVALTFNKFNELFPWRKENV
ncbi:MAG: AAA family ATPase [bacterium]|nr:AAA family ATPase [bacterium]MDZ4284835.1 AAA family ATPase [Patescibacteria group bacterium]